jgi:hypothetical protein
VPGGTSWASRANSSTKDSGRRSDLRAGSEAGGGASTRGGGAFGSSAGFDAAGSAGLAGVGSRSVSRWPRRAWAASSAAVMAVGASFIVILIGKPV